MPCGFDYFPLLFFILSLPVIQPLCLILAHKPSSSMESLLQQSRAMCPFLKNTSPTALRSLSTATRPSPSGGRTVSNLHAVARRCPVMSKALAVQSARLSPTKRFASTAATVAGVNSLRTCPVKRELHTTSGNGASLNPGTYQRNERGMYFSGYLM